MTDITWDLLWIAKIHEHSWGGKRPETWFDIVCQNAKSCIVFKSNVASISLNIGGADNL